MRQRLSLARALMHRPQVLFLDEPTSGLDPQSAQAVHALLRRLAREEGTTCFLCTHQLRYAQEICTCYGLMDQGRLLPRAPWTSPGPRWAGGGTLLPPGRGPPLPFPQTGPGRYEIPIAGEEDIPALVRQAVAAGGRDHPGPPPGPHVGGPLLPPHRSERGGFAMNRGMLALIRKDLRSVTANHRMLVTLLVVPLVLTVFLPTVAVVTLHTAPEEAADFQSSWPSSRWPPGGAWSGRS